MLVAILPWQVQATSSNNNYFLFDCFLVLLLDDPPNCSVGNINFFREFDSKAVFLNHWKYKYFTLAYKNAVLDTL